jgi:outer membrane receptor protein involved in Fe transport
LMGNAKGMIDGATIALGASPRIGVAFAPLENLVLKANYDRGFRAPTVQELALELPSTANNQGRVVGNPSLSPAYLDQVEGSLEYLFGLSEAKARVRGAGFYDKFTNPIGAVDTTGNLYPYENRLDGVQAYGVEIEARLEVGPRAGAWVNFSWVRVQDLGTVPTAWYITDVPQLRFNGGFSIPLGPFLTADVFGNVHGERRNNSRSVLELLRRYRLPAYSLLGLQLRTEPLFEHVELSFQVHNVFDVDYADDAPREDRITGGVPREGLSAALGARVFF